MLRQASRVIHYARLFHDHYTFVHGVTTKICSWGPARPLPTPPCQVSVQLGLYLKANWNMHMDKKISLWSRILRLRYIVCWFEELVIFDILDKTMSGILDIILKWLSIFDNFCFKIKMYICYIWYFWYQSLQYIQNV